MSTDTDRDGFGLACQHCAYRFPMDIPMGVAKAHFETEHDTTDVRFDLVVVCRCGETMTLERQDIEKLYFGCPKCHRSRVVSNLRVS